MQQIADWLEKLGMSEYAQRFAENRIDLSVLPDLTDQHLKDIGIALGASAENACARSGSFRVPSWHRRSLRLPSRRPRTPQSAAKSR